MATSQMTQWMGDFGRQYTDRNALSLQELDALSKRNYGIGRREINSRFLAEIPAAARILEVGCNIGNQLMLLQAMGYHNLYGIEIQEYALEMARSRLQGVQLQRASAFGIPYPDGYFDLVFTSGVLIHVAPGDLQTAMSEIHRCSSAYLWGFEYYSPEMSGVEYRGHANLLWKGDYPKLYLRQFPDLELVKTERLRYLDSSNEDCVFLLKKRA